MTTPKPVYRFCQDCFIDISRRNARAIRCKECAKEHTTQLSKNKQELIYFRARRERQKQIRHQGLEYPFQSNAEDGQSYILPYNTVTLRIAKVCANCKRDDSEVKGLWGPIYTVTNLNGDEINPTLLCLSCYNAQCEKDWGEGSWAVEQQVRAG